MKLKYTIFYKNEHGHSKIVHEEKLEHEIDYMLVLDYQEGITEKMCDATVSIDSIEL